MKVMEQLNLPKMSILMFETTVSALLLLAFYVLAEYFGGECPSLSFVPPLNHAIYYILFG